MVRIAEGIRQHCDDRLAAYAAAVESLTPGDVERLQADVVAAGDVAEAVADRGGPFLVEGHAAVADGGRDQQPRPDAPTTLTVPMVMGQHSGALAKPAAENPLPTVAAAGAIHYINAEPFVLPRNGAFRGLHSNPTYDPAERPLHTVTAKNHDGHVVTPFLVEYNGNSDVAGVDEPLPTVTATDRHALCTPDLYPWGLDLRYRMLQPRELAAAQGFPDDYQFAGNKTETTRQIGNAVPVSLGKSLVKQLLLPTDQPAISQWEDEPPAVADGGVADGD